MRSAIRVLVGVLTVAAVACTGGGDEAASPSAASTSVASPSASAIPLGQRFATAEDAPGSSPDPVEKRQTTEDLDVAVTMIGQIDPAADLRTVLDEAGFEAAGVDTRFFGEKHSRNAPHLDTTFVLLGSEDGATSTLDWLEADSKKPCPESCATEVSAFDPGIPGVRGTHRIATAQAIENAGFADEIPSDDYWVGFTDGSSVYTMVLHGPPGSVSEAQAREIARAYHDRVTAL